MALPPLVAVNWLPHHNHPKAHLSFQGRSGLKSFLRVSHPKFWNWWSKFPRCSDLSQLAVDSYLDRYACSVGSEISLPGVSSKIMLANSKTSSFLSSRA